VADRDGERVGRVVGARRLGQAQQRLHHPLDLVLAGAAAAADGALDLLGRVVRARHAALAGGHEDRPARLADGESCANVLTEIQSFEGDRIGLVLDEQVRHPLVQDGQAPLGRHARARLDHAAVERGEPPGPAHDDAVTGVRQAGIDAEDHHPAGILRVGSDAFPDGPRLSSTSVQTLNTNLHRADAPTVLRRGDKHELRRALATARSRVADLEAELRDRSRLDPRTRVLTHDAFREAADRELHRAATGSRSASVALIDIDGFRALNAHRGLRAGDAALGAVAGRLRRIVRGVDLLGRTGADEIAVLLPGTRAGGAQACCDRLIEALAQTRIPHAGRVTVSAGFAACAPGVGIDAALAEAARGLDLARAEGGARAAAAPDDDAPGGPVPRHADVIEALSTALLERDRYTGEHSADVVGLVRHVAHGVGLDPAEVERVAAAALVHDVGKVAIPDRVLHKASALDEDDWALMREHPVIGERILRRIPGMGAVARIVRHEHERFDGGGYPDGLAGDAIPIGSRVILACDAYHAMTSDRPSRRALGHDHAVGELADGAGTQFDPRVVTALLDHLSADDAVVAGA
jgi:diguanylate cyclase (GGDEF)-like protein